MAKYFDAFVIPVPKKNLRAYRQFAKKSAKLWIEHGALEYVETLADDVTRGKNTSFPRGVKMKGSETVAFVYVAHKSKKHRDLVHKRVMNDPRSQDLWDHMPFDGMRMIYGGFKKLLARGR